MKFSIATLVVLLVSLTRETSHAFVAPQPRVGGPSTFSQRQQAPKPLASSIPSSTTSTTTQLQSSVTDFIDGQRLTTYFLETLITNGVPALFTILVIGFAAKAFRSNKNMEQERLESGNNPVTELYNDLYGDSTTSAAGKRPFFLGKGRQQNLQNTGIPSQQYIKITNRNNRLDSYQYSMNAATQSKAMAASQARSQNFDKALKLGISSSASELTPNQKSLLMEAEKAFLKRASPLASEVALIQTQLTKSAIDDEMKALGMSPTEMDPALGKVNGDEAVDANVTATNVTLAVVNREKKNGMSLPFVGSKKSKQLKEVGILQENLLGLELGFIQQVVQILGPERANGIKAALLGDVATRGAGGLLAQLQDRPLSMLLKQVDANADERTKSLFVTQFPGDPTASQVADLREEVTAIVRNSKPGDEALVVLQTGGGTVTGYGLAAAQLQRFKQNGMKLTICVEQVAASGGYMMSCVADKIIASPFAVLGSIGVISDIPNVYERLKEEGIEFQTITAGKYKRTITPTKKVTPQDMKKSKEDIEEVLKLFKAFVKENRPSLDIEKVATGETWFGTDALERNLCDEIKTVDDVVTEYVDAGYNVYDVKYEPPPETPQFASLIPVGANDNGEGGIVSRAVKWLVRTIAAEVKSEMNNLDISQSTRPDRKYMMKDDTSERIRAE